jgi:hypothetical protein
MGKYQQYQLIKPYNSPQTFTTHSLEDAANYYFNHLASDHYLDQVGFNFTIKNQNVNKNISFYAINTKMGQRGGSSKIDQDFLNKVDTMTDSVLRSVTNLKEVIQTKKQLNEPLLILLNEKIDNISKKIDVMSEEKKLQPVEKNDLINAIKVSGKEKKSGYCTIM